MKSRTVALLVPLALLAGLAALLWFDRSEPAPEVGDEPERVALAEELAPREEVELAPAEILVPPTDLRPTEVAPQLEALADVHGEVLDLDDQPLAELWIAAMDEDDVIERTRSDADGAFRFALPKHPTEEARRELRLAAEAPEGWGQIDGAHALSGKEARGEAPVLLRLKPSPTLAVTGVVRDARTGEAVPSVDVQVMSAAGAESVRTDGYGAFTTLGAFPSGPLRVSVSDGEGKDRVFLATFDEEHFASVHLRRPLELDVPIGPTYRLDIAALATVNPGPWRFRLVERQGDPRIAGRLASGGGGGRGRRGDGNLALVDGPEEPPRDWGSVPLRLDPTGAWVRFPRIVFDPDNDRDAKEPWRAELSSFHPRFRTRTEVVSTVGIDPLLRKPDIRPNAVVQGLVHDERGQPIPGVEIELLPARSDSWRAGRPDRCVAFQPTGGGSYVFRDVEPGPWRLVAEAPEHYVVSTELLVVQGPNELAPLKLAHARGQSVCSGKVNPTDYEVRHSLVAALAPRWRDGLGPWRVTEFDRYGFRIDGLPHDEYDLHLFSDIGAWPLYRKRVSLPTRFLEAKGPERATPVEFHVTDPAGQGLHFELVHDLGQGVVVSEHYAHAAALDGPRPGPFRLWSHGYRPFEGDGGDLVQRDGKLRVEAQLEPGWGAVLHLREGEQPRSATAGLRRGEWRSVSSGTATALFTHPAVPGVEVVSEYGLAGVSGSNGQVLVSTPAPASELVLAREGWRVRAIERLHGHLSDSRSIQEYAVWMVRDNLEDEEIRERGER